MSSKSSERNTEIRGKAKNDEERYVKLRKTLLFLFAKDGLEKRNIRHEKDDEVAVEDILASEHFGPQFVAEDFEHAVAKDIHDLILKVEPQFLLVANNGRRVVKYYKEPLKYKESTDVIQLNDGATVVLSKESVALEKVISDDESGKHEEHEEKEQRNEPTTGGSKKKKNQKNKAGTGRSQGDTNKNQSKKENEDSPVPNAPVVKEPSVSAEYETKAEIVSSENGKPPTDSTDSSPKGCPSKETIAEGESAKSENKDQVLKDSSAIESDEVFSIVVGKKGSKKSPDKKGNQSEASGKKKSGNESKQNKDSKQTAESPGKAGKQTDKSQNKQTKEQKANESKQNNNDKEKTKSENLQKIMAEDVNSTALSSDEEKTEEQPRKKQKNKPEDRPKKITSTFNYLFGEKNGINEKKIFVGDGGFVKVKAIIECYLSHYDWTEDEITSVLGNNEDYKFKRDDTDCLLVKAAEKITKSEAVDQPVAMGEPADSDSWEEPGRRKEGQEDRRQRPPQNSDRNSDFAGKSDFHLSKSMSFILRHGAEKLQLAIEPDGFMFVDDLLSHKDLRSYKEDDVKRVVRNNDKQRFLIAEDPTTGRLKVRANQGHTFVVPDLELQPITNANDAPTVVHGTYHNSWKIIKEQGLSRMTRNHIHFAVGEPGSDGVISGMRGSCDVLVFIDMQTALNDGIKFFRSANNVILSPGDDKGIVSPKYFKAAVQRSPRMKLM